MAARDAVGTTTLVRKLGWKLVMVRGSLSFQVPPPLLERTGMTPILVLPSIQYGSSF